MSYRYPLPAVSELFWPPIAPHAYDDEFHTNVLDPKWTRNYTASATPISPFASFAAGDTRESINTLRESYILLQPPGPGGVARAPIGISQLVPGGLPDGLYMSRIRWEYRVSNITSDDGGGALILAASSGGQPDDANKIFCSPIDPDTSSVSSQANRTLGGVDTITNMSNMNGFGPMFEYSAIIRSGNNFSCFVGNDVTWTFLATFAWAGPTIDRIFLAAYTNSTDPPGNMISGFDYFRYVARQDLP